MLTIAFKYVSTACSLKKNLSVCYHSKQVLIATLSLCETLNTRILLNVQSLCIFSGEKTLYQELSVCL